METMPLAQRLLERFASMHISFFLYRTKSISISSSLKAPPSAGPAQIFIFLYASIYKNCRQNFYGFQNLMSTWGWGVKIFKITIGR